MKEHHIAPEDAELIWNWLQDRGGIAIWNCDDVRNAAQTWTTPVLNNDGTRRTEKPHWSAGEVIRVITNPAEVVVVEPKEIKRFHVAVVRRGMKLVVSDGGSRRIRREIAKAGHGAWYEFDDWDYGTVIIFVPAETTPISEFIRTSKPEPTAESS